MALSPGESRSRTEAKPPGTLAPARRARSKATPLRPLAPFERISPGPALRRAWAALIAALVVASVINLALAWQAGLAQAGLQQREFELVRQARLLESASLGLVSDGRGYLLTRDDRFLDDLTAGQEKSRAALTRLRDLVDTPGGNSLVDGLESQLDGVIDGVLQRVELARQGRLDAASAQVLGARDVQAQLFTSLDLLVDQEEELLSGRLAQVQNERLSGLAIGALLLVAASLLVVALLRRAQETIESSQRELVQRARQAALAAEVGSALITSQTLPIKLRLCAGAIVRHLHGAFAGVWTLGDDPAVLELQASAGQPVGPGGPPERLVAAESDLGRLVLARQPWLNNNLGDDVGLVDAAWLSRTGVVAAAAYPLITEDRLVGVVALFSREPLSESISGALAAVVPKVALGIDQARAVTERLALLEREQAARGTAERAIQVRDDFLSSASHDLKTPLAAIKGYAQFLQSQLRRPGSAVADRLEQGLAQIDASATRMAGLVDGLLDVARLEGGGQLELELRPTDLVSLARQVIAEHEQTTQRHQINLVSSQPTLIGRWDSARLRRALDNLLSNAIKYSPAGGEITVSLSRRDDSDGRSVVVEVRDQGLGIPASDLPHVFERFHRAENVAGHISGTGLGLASTQHIVEQHAGAITVESREGSGSTFTVLLPLSPDSERLAQQLQGNTVGGLPLASDPGP